MHSPASPQNKSRRRWTLAGIGAAVAGTLALSACDPAWHHHGGHHRGGFAAMTPEEASKRIDKAVAWVLDDVDATADQKQRVAAIAKSAMQDLMPMREQHRLARTKAVELFAQPAIDRVAMENLRVEELRLAEAASKRFVQALADAAELLNPAQRAKLAEQIKQRWS